MTKTNVPPTRAQFRSQLLSNELKYVTKAGGELHGEEEPQGATDAAGGAAAKKTDAQEPTKGVGRRGRRASVELERLKSTHTIDEHIEATETGHSAHGISRFTAPHAHKHHTGDMEHPYEEAKALGEGGDKEAGQEEQGGEAKEGKADAGSKNEE